MQDHNTHRYTPEEIQWLEALAAGAVAQLIHDSSSSSSIEGGFESGNRRDESSQGGVRPIPSCGSSYIGQTGPRVSVISGPLVAFSACVLVRSVHVRVCACF